MRNLPGARLVRRAVNLGRRFAAGLTLFGENVSPEVRNDLFVAHLSIYQFAAQFAHGARVLDLGCGAGYGSAYLAGVAASVTAVDLDPRNIRYARRHYPQVRFIEGDASDLPAGVGSFDLVVASNVLEHLEDVTRCLDSISCDRLIVAVPPITDDASLRANEAIPYHRTNLLVPRWMEILDARFEGVRTYRHFWREGIEPDFGDPYRSRLEPDDFRFEEADLMAEPSLTALFVCGKSRATHGG